MTPARTLAAAIRHHKAGRIAAAQAAYGTIPPDSAVEGSALYLRAAAHGQRGETAAAERLFAGCIAGDPWISLFDSELGSRLRAAGDYDALVRRMGTDLMLRSGCRLAAAPGGQTIDLSYRPHLAGVTLVCIDTLYHDLSLVALKNCLAQCTFDEVLFLSDRPFDLPTIRSVVIDPLPSTEAYSAFVLRQLHRHIRTSHALIVQWDGFVMDVRLWTPEFLDYDYVGAPWAQFDDDMRVGNGGFSLRSRRFLTATTDTGITQVHPEDFHVCRTYRKALIERYGLRYAPVGLADRFSIERVASSEEIAAPSVTFGFHGLFRMHRVLDTDHLDNFLDDLPPGALSSNGLLMLAASYMQLCRAAPALRLASRIRSAVPGHRYLQLLDEIIEAATAALVAAGQRPAPEDAPVAGGSP